ncbi:hypothetical protein LZ30DRAFT_707121 [Colletotrichum cereale]|nr:hypothetical protein LZ30DRAFT_707121 [Colletotrichum cereale]
MEEGEKRTERWGELAESLYSEGEGRVSCARSVGLLARSVACRRRSAWRWKAQVVFARRAYLLPTCLT